MKNATRLKPCGCPDTGPSRRSFLKGMVASGAVAGFVTQGLSTRLAFAAPGRNAAAAAGAYAGDTLVVLSLRGGFDGLQAIVPAADPDYATWRPNIAIPQSALLQLDQTFGMHPAMAPLKPLWDAGTFGVVHAVGQADPNRSHFEAMEEMERAAPGTSLRTGWIDRVLGLRGSGTPFQGMQVGTDLADASFTGPSPELAIDSVDSFGLDAAWDALRPLFENVGSAYALDLGKAVIAPVVDGWACPVTRRVLSRRSQFSRLQPR